jgi:hypothetical protein
MPSLLAWLDHSEEDQRRMRELVALFAQEESRDELGIGAIRDAFSDACSLVRRLSRLGLDTSCSYRGSSVRPSAVASPAMRRRSGQRSASDG